MAKKVDPNSKAYQLEMQAETLRINEAVRRLAAYPEFAAYLTVLHEVEETAKDTLRKAKGWDEFNYRVGWLDLLSDIIDNSESYIDAPPPTTK